MGPLVWQNLLSMSIDLLLFSFYGLDLSQGTTYGHQLAFLPLNDLPSQPHLDALFLNRIYPPIRPGELDRETQILETLEAFLDYHLQQYRLDGGVQQDFLRHVRRLIHWHGSQLKQRRNRVEQAIFDWLEQHWEGDFVRPRSGSVETYFEFDGQPLDSNPDQHFLKTLIAIEDPDGIHPFLDYPFYAYPGDPQAFLDHTKLLLKDHIRVHPGQTDHQAVQAVRTWLNHNQAPQTETSALEMKTTTRSPLKWKGSQSELLELVYALLESGTIEASSKTAALHTFQEIFGFSINNPDQLLNKIKHRNYGSETLFLDKLREAFAGYVNPDKR